MAEADATSPVPAGWRDEVVVATGIWVVFTGVVVAIAPVVAALPLPLGAAVVLPACVLVGWVVGRAFARRRPRPAAGLRLGVAVVVVGQLLDVVLLVVAGEYPRAGAEGSFTVVALLLGGYPAALVGAALADHARSGRPAGEPGAVVARM